MTHNRHMVVVALAMAASFWISSARADVIPELFNTGVDETGAVLPDSAHDPHYQVFSTTVPGVVPGYPARTFDPLGLPSGGDDADWITLPETAIGVGPSTTTFRLTFSLDAFDASTAQVSGRWATGDFAAMFLNGAFTGNLTQNGVLSAFVLTQGFAPGLNVLDFQVTNYSRPATGLLVDDLHGAAALHAAVPEPAAWALMITGFYGAGGLLRRRRHGQALA